jgi:hypothetical protein
MNCAQFQEVLPELLESNKTAEQDSHLKTCPTCSDLVSELDLIAREARHLRETDEPNPRVWASIEIALRNEGIIREASSGPVLLPPVPRRWNTLAWLAPAAAVLLIGFGIFGHQRIAGRSQTTADARPTPAVTRLNPQPGKSKAVVNNSRDRDEDQQLLAAVASRSPAMQAQYASNLQNVNSYIEDAEQSAESDPNDEQAQQIVMDAYEQRAAVYEMALDRSLP